VRPTVVLSACLFAAFWGATQIAMGLALLAGTWSLEGIIVVYGMTLPAVAIVGTPVAIPAIIWTERRRLGDVRLFAFAGALPSALLLFLFSDSLDAPGGALLIFSGIGAALSYWLVAWKLFPPSRTPGANSAP
jgi:hypothetical protein